MSPTSPDSAPPAYTGASPYFPEKQATRQTGPSHAQGPPQPIPTPEHMQACRASLHISGARPWPTGRPHEAPRAPIAKRDGARYFGPPWPSLRHGRYDRLVCLQFLAREVSPRRYRKARIPRHLGGCGLKKRVQVLICLTSRRPGGGDVGLDAQHDAHGEDADDCGDAGDRRVQRCLPTLSVPPTRPASYSQGCAPSTSLSRPHPVPGTFSSHTT